MSKIKSEVELAEKVISWLVDDSWDIYQEVQLSTYGRIADIVAVHGGVVWIIECKTSTGLTVIEQAYRWKNFSHYVSVAVPVSSKQNFFESVIRKFGIGCISVSQYGDPFETVRAKLNRQNDSKKIISGLSKEQKTFAQSGNSEGKRWTPFNSTRRNIVNAVSSKPGITLKELIDSIDTHYHTVSTAKSCIRKWIELDKVPGVTMKRDGKIIKLYPEVK
jgi:hypothetical protein